MINFILGLCKIMAQIKFPNYAFKWKKIAI